MISDFAKITFCFPFIQQTFTEYLLFSPFWGFIKTFCPQQVYNSVGKGECSLHETKYISIYDGGADTTNRGR